MPEMIEVEDYRRLGERALGRTIAGVDASDSWYLKGATSPSSLVDALIGRSFIHARRRGKLMLLDTSEDGPVLGLRFGMSGRLVVDGSIGVEKLQYGQASVDARYSRFAVFFDDGGSMVMSDPRRLGGVELEPDESRLGVDALGVGLSGLSAALAGTKAPLKARLLDQAHIAGIGNLLADEILWRAGLSPLRPAGRLTRPALEKLHRHMQVVLHELTERGGSHTGDLMPERRPGGRCRRDGAELARQTVGGRTTYWCPKHQK
jgi:formamidopyrimidine-DNA glycosylase